VDVFALGAGGSNAPVTHAVFPIEIALIMANKKRNIPLLDLHGSTLAMCSTGLSPLLDGFNKSFYSIKVVRIDCTCNDAQPLGKINTFFDELLIYIRILTIFYTILGSQPGCSEAMGTRFVNPSMLEGVDALLIIGKGKCEDQLLLLRFFLPQPIFPDGDLI
jgi:hypothetical protein